MTSLISSLSWIPRGAAAPNPTKYAVDEAELARIQGLAKGQLDAAKLELEIAQMMENDGVGLDDDDNEEEDEEGGRDGENGDADWEE